jgi:integrase
MPVRRNTRGQWIYRTTVKLADGSKVRIFGTPEINTKAAALLDEELHIKRVKSPDAASAKKEVPTLKQWFYGDADPKDPATEPAGRFWREWVQVQNKPSEQESKKSIYRNHLGPALGPLALDRIGAADIAKLRASLVEKKRSRKRVNNVLCVLSKVLRYAADIELIDRAPKIGLLKCERPEIEVWSFEEYARVLRAAHAAGPTWYTAVVLAGEAGLRVGEVKGLRWDDVDLVGRSLTVQQQIRKGIAGTPKGGRRRVVAMTDTLLRALKSMDVVRTGFVVRNPDGGSIRDGQATNAIRRICRKAGLPLREWHTLRHSFGTHLALLGVNPFRLQAWMGHARMEETLLYVHLAQAHPRPLPQGLLQAGATEPDPDRRVLKMLSARAGEVVGAAAHPWALRRPVRRGTRVAPDRVGEPEALGDS